MKKPTKQLKLPKELTNRHLKLITLGGAILFAVSMILVIIALFSLSSMASADYTGNYSTDWQDLAAHVGLYGLLISQALLLVGGGLLLLRIYKRGEHKHKPAQE